MTLRLNFLIPFLVAVAAKQRSTSAAVSAFSFHPSEQIGLDQIFKGRNASRWLSSPRGLFSTVTSQRKYTGRNSTLLRGNVAKNDNLGSSSLNSEAHGSAASNKSTVLATAVVSFVAVSIAAKAGFLPGPTGLDGVVTAYTDDLIRRDMGAATLCAFLGAAFVKLCTTLAKNGMLEPRDSRKVIHTFSAPLFMLFWPLFSDAEGARFFAAIIPLVNAVRLALAGSGAQGGDEELANAVSRSGDIREALGGPFVYVLMILFMVLSFWRSNLTGVVALSMMAAGDGVADIVGRRYGKTNKWPFSADKSVAGSSAFFFASTTCAISLAWWFSYTGVLMLPSEISFLGSQIALISGICTAIELVPFGDDNWTVPLGAVLLSLAILQ